RPLRMISGISAFSSTLKAEIRWWNWNTKSSDSLRIRVRVASSLLRVGRPCRESSPAVGTSSRPIRLSRVLLLDPDGPISAVSSPRPSRRLMSCSTLASSAVPWFKLLPMPYRRRTSSYITDRHRRIIVGGTAGRLRRCQHAGQAGDQHGRRYQPRLDRHLEQPRTEDVEHLHQQPAHGAADSRTEQTEQAALQQEYPQDLPAGAAHGAQDADLPAALHH